MQYFHAHIYYDPNQLTEIKKIQEQVFLNPVFSKCKLFTSPVGPHPKAMLELHFDDLCFKAAIAWLDAKCLGFSVLIHQDTGDDFKDHTEDIRWLGEVLPIDFSFFELIQSKPELRIHT